MKSDAEPEDEATVNRRSGIAYGAAISLFAAVAAFLAIGWMLDRWLGTKPWLLVAGIVLGSAAGFYQFVRATSKLS
ncbi:MAG: AtpZ/AtpI family protein [Pyrinomonadaceae bacterium]